MTTKISAGFPYKSQYIDVNGSKLHYIEQGQGYPILLLHGMPASAYLWRNVIPHLSTLGRCIAPDLIGMGKSDKPDIEYSIADHINYITQFIETMNLKNIIFVMHGWGSIIGLSYAMLHEKNCRALAFYESFLRPMNGVDFSLPLQEQIHLLDQQENIIDLVKDGTYYIDNILPKEMLRALTSEELAYYRQPFLQEGAAKVIQQYFKEIPRGSNGKTRVNQIIADYSSKLMQSKLPKLLLYSVPGYITPIASVVWAKENLPNLEVVEVGEELHFAPESNPVLMGEAISIWLQGVEQQPSTRKS